MELISEAVSFAARAHDGMRRKDGGPYILHPMEAAVIVGTMTNDQEVIAAAVLHDVVEDACVTLEEVAAAFGDRVALLVASETENKREELPPESTWKLRKTETLAALRTAEDPDVRTVWLGDKLANLRAIYRSYRVEGDAIWQRFNQKSVAEQAWYYRSIAKLTSSLADTAAWLEYHKLTELVFGKENEHD